MQLYIALNALMWIALGLWCGYSPASTSKSVGFDLIGNQGISEFVAVYGGLEFGIGLFYLAALVFPEFVTAGILVSVLVYGGIVAFRTSSIVLHGAEIGNAWYFYALEIVMFLWALILYLGLRSQQAISPVS